MDEEAPVSIAHRRSSSLLRLRRSRLPCCKPRDLRANREAGCL